MGEAPEFTLSEAKGMGVWGYVPDINPLPFLAGGEPGGWSKEKLGTL